MITKGFNTSAVIRGKCKFESETETENMPYIDKTDTLYASYEFETKTKTLESCDTCDKSCLYMAGTIHSRLHNKLP